MNVNLSYSNCTIYTEGIGGMDCPLCHMHVPDGERHDCERKALPTKALSIRAPWWWFILHGGKDIENRDWPTKFRGTVYIHSSKRWQKGEIFEALCFCDRTANTQVRDSTTQVLQLREGLGCIVGQVDIVDCVSKSDSPWFFGDYGFVLANPVAFAQPVPCKGALGFFSVPDDVLAQIKA